MRILHVVAPAEVGGLERVVEMLAQGQARHGDDIHVAAVLEWAGPDNPFLALLGEGIGAHPLLVPTRAYGRERAAVRDLCRRLRPDVVHTHGYRPDVVDAGVARALRIPTVTTVHGFTGGSWKNRLYERLQRRVFRRFDAVVAVSHPLRQRLLHDGVPADRLHVLQNAWRESAPPLDRWMARHTLGASWEGFRVGWVGRLSHEKGPDILLDALTHLTDLPVRVSMVGSGAARRSLHDQARRLGVDHQIQWHGTVPDIARLLAAFDVFVLSSRTEGTPIVLFEAMAAGVPIVAASVGGVPDVVSPADAVLVPPDHPLALAAAIRAVARDPVGAHERAQRARERLGRDFALSPWIQRYGAIYSLVSDRTPEAVTA